MDSADKENMDPTRQLQDEDAKNYSLDSLDCGPIGDTAPSANVELLIPINGNDQQKPFAQDGDVASNNRADITREVEQYVENLARELIDSVKQDGEPEQEEVKAAEVTQTVKQEEEEQAKEVVVVDEIEKDARDDNKETNLIQESEEQASEIKRLDLVDSKSIEPEEKADEPAIDPLETSTTNSNPNDSPTIRKRYSEAHQTFQTAAGNSFLDFEAVEEPPKMEFTKNYSDDLLMGQADAVQGELVSGGADLADFELPPYSGSSSGSEPRQQSPAKQRKSSSSATAQASSSQSVSVSPPDLAALKNLLMSSYSQVSHVFHWKKPIETGIIFSIGLTLITTLTFLSIISVVAYSALGIIFASGLIRIYKAVMKALNRPQETPFDHIWDKVLKLNVSLSPTKMHELIDASLSSFNSSLLYFKQVLLVEDKFATLKFAITLYLLTYIGAWFNGMTLITLSYLALFSVPIFYEKYKAKIDVLLNLATTQATSAVSMLTNKITSLVFSSSPAPSGSGIKKQN